MAGSLSSDEVERYRRDGILAPLPVLPAAEAAACHARYQAFRTAHSDEARAIFRAKPHLLFPWIYDLVRDPRVLDPVESILGPNLLVWGTSFFAKEAHDPAYVTWHQDSTYWGLEPHDILTAWIALTASRRENGCMRVVPGSHRGGQLAHRDTFAADNILSRGQELEVEVDEADARDVALAPGEMSLHHVGIVHGSEPNPSELPRVGLVIRYIPSHVRQRSGRTTATLARGVDEFGHFDLEPRPQGDCAPAARAFRDASLAATASVLMDGAAENRVY